MWYVIWTLAGKEESCKKQIENICDSSTYIRAVIPKKKISQKKNGVRRYVETKLFPSYVLVETLDASSFAINLKKIEGFSKILGQEGSYMPLDEKESRMISKLLGDGDTVEASIGYVEGDKIVITEGPMEGMESQIRYIDRHKRIAYIEMNLFDRIVDVKVPLEIVEKL